MSSPTENKRPTWHYRAKLQEGIAEDTEALEMTTVAHLRKTASALPETTEGTHDGIVTFSVRGKGFVSVTADGWLQLRLPETRVDEFLADHSVGERMTRGSTPIGLRVRLVDINGMVLNVLVRASWSHRAPKRLSAAAAQAESAVPGKGDLPTAIGRPATRALHGAGLTSLDQVASQTEAELLALHGVGPKAIRLLTEALTERGLALR